MPRKTGVEYLVKMDDNDVIIKKDVSSARKFVRYNKSEVKSIERRVYKDVGKGGEFWEKSLDDTVYLTPEELLNKDMRKL